MVGSCEGTQIFEFCETEVNSIALKTKYKIINVKIKVKKA